MLSVDIYTSSANCHHDADRLLAALLHFLVMLHLLVNVFVVEVAVVAFYHSVAIIDDSLLVCQRIDSRGCSLVAAQHLQSFALHVVPEGGVGSRSGPLDVSGLRVEAAPHDGPLQEGHVVRHAALHQVGALTVHRPPGPTSL